MENKVDIEPNSTQNHATDEQQGTADLLHKMGSLALVVLLDSRCQLRRSNSHHRTIRDTDHHRDIGSNGEDARVI